MELLTYKFPSNTHSLYFGIVIKDGEMYSSPWAVCNFLGIKWPDTLIEELAEYELWKVLDPVPPHNLLNSYRSMVNESGLYYLIHKAPESQLKQEFKKWIASTLIPYTRNPTIPALPLISVRSFPVIL